MSKRVRDKQKVLKDIHGFHEQAKRCGGLMELYIIRRSEAPLWLTASFFDEKIRRIVEVMDDALMRWEKDGAGLLCLTCDNSAERPEDIEAYAFLSTYDSSKSDKAMVCALCSTCANRPDLESAVMSVFKEKVWPNLRIAPPIHQEAGHA